ncbi:hypothetical protein Tco_1266123 [Tanacetum coccineum]
MSTQQDIFTAGFENHPPMLNKDNYVPWSSRLLCYVKSKPNGKLLVNLIKNGPYVRRIIHEPGDPNSVPPVAESTHEQTDDELTNQEAKQVEDDDQAIQYLWMMKGSTIGAQEKKAKLEKYFPENIASNLKFLNNLQPEWNRSVTVVQQTKDLYEVDYTQLYDFLKFNQAEIAGNQNGYNVVHNVRNRVVQNAVQTLRAQNAGNQNGLIVVPGIAPPIANQNASQNGNGNVVAARAEGNANWNNGNQIRCYNYRGLDHYARNCTFRPRRRDAAYLQTQLLITQKEEARIQLQAEEFDLIVPAGDINEIDDVNANCVLMDNLQQASTSGIKIGKAPIYDSDGTSEEEQYTKLLEPILEPHQIQKNDSNVIPDASSVEQSGGTVDQNPATAEEIRAHFESLYNNLTTEVERLNMVNHKMCKTNADLTTKLARYKCQEKSFEINKEKFDELETEEKKKLKSDFKIRKDELLDKQIELEKKIKRLDNILVKQGHSIQTMHMLIAKPDSFYHIEQKMALGYPNPHYLKQAQQKQQSLYNGRVLLEKHDPPVVYDLEETLQLAQEIRLKMKQLNKEIKLANYAKINKLFEVFVSQKAKSREQVYFSNTSKMANVSKSFSIPNEESSDDTLSVA